MAKKLICRKAYRNTALACALLLLQASALPITFPHAALALVSSSDGNSSGPSGTLLLPLTPKLDVPSEDTNQAEQSKAKTSAKTDASDNEPVLDVTATDDVVVQPNQASNQITNDQDAKDGAAQDSIGQMHEDSDSVEGEDTNLKGTVQIVADDTEYDQDKNTFLGTGNAVALIAGQASKLEADTILYDENTQMIDARGNVRILRNGQLTTGSAFKFKVTSDEYLITNPDTEVQGSTIIARKGFGANKGMSFRDGFLTIPQGFYLAKNAYYGPLGYAELMGPRMQHPDAYMPLHQSFKFKARKMVYERYKDSGNLTIYGARIEFGNFSIPIGKFVATVGQENNRVVFPISPIISNNLQMGGTNIGPSFNYVVGKNGKLSWAPMIQLGGRDISGSGSNVSSVGVAGQISYTSNHVSAHLAYGSVSNLLVADYKYFIRKGFRFQSGINRFIDDGIFGYRRARLIAELVDNHPLKTQIPFISGVTFRTSAGIAQDNPNLVNITPQYAALFNTSSSSSSSTPEITVTKMPTAFKLQEQIQATTQPLFVIGNQRWGVKSYIYTGLALRAYSTGDKMAMGQIGPILDLHLTRLRLQTGYTQSAVRGQSPFVYDQFIQGDRSVFAQGSFKVNRYLTLGGNISYDLISKLSTSKTVMAAIGPEDFKVILSREFITGTNRFGFDVLYGQPIPFDKLVMKGRADQGQLGGI